MKHSPHTIRVLLFTCLTGSLLLWSAIWADDTHAAPSSTELHPLPAPLYVLTTEHEVVRLHQNGQVMGQLTNEFEQIEDFDVSPVHGRLVYTLGNRLIELDPYSGERVVKFDAILHNRGWISSPRYSPDGHQITFIMQGTLWSTGSSTKKEGAFHRLIPAAAAEQIALGELFDVSWSPNGDQIATVRWKQATTVDGHHEDAYSEIARYAIFPVDTPPQKLQSTRLDDLFTCEAFGENSASESLYRQQLQDRFPYTITHLYDWLENDILLFWVGCGATVKRFDLATNQMLVADPLDLQQITVDPTRRCWVARGQEKSYLGATDIDAFTELALPPNRGVTAWGNRPDHLLYTVRRDMGGESFGELARYSEAGFAYIGDIPVNLHYYETELWLHPLSQSINTTQTPSRSLPTDTVSAQDRLLTQSFHYGYTSIHETQSGDLFFIAVENDTRLADAIRNDIAPEGLQAYLPTSHLMRLPAGKTVAERWVENVQHVAVFSNTTAPCHLLQMEQMETSERPINAPTAVLVPTRTPTPQPITRTPQAVPTPTITEAPTDTSVLPAPLYYLNNQGQIMRLEMDGATVHQITNEASTITDFAVDPLGDYLVYVSDNNLIRIDSTGGNRQLLIASGAVGTALYANNKILGFAIAPNGKQLALARYGVYLIDDITAPDPFATMKMIVPNIPAVPRARRPAYDLSYFVSASSWSPDGTKLLLTAASAGDSFSKMIFDLQSDQLIELTVPTAKQEHERSLHINLSCYTPTLGGIHWSRTAEAFFISNDVYGMYGPPGLSVVSAIDGVVRPLFYAYTACHPDVLEIREEAMRFFRGVHQTKSGDLWGFVNPSYDPKVPGILPLQMAHIDPLAGKLTPMRNDTYTLAHEILWAADDSGALVIVRQRKGDMLDEETGELTWLPSNGAPALRLGLDGEQLQWGK